MLSGVIGQPVEVRGALVAVRPEEGVSTGCVHHRGVAASTTTERHHIPREQVDGLAEVLEVETDRFAVSVGLVVSVSGRIGGSRPPAQQLHAERTVAAHSLTRMPRVGEREGTYCTVCPVLAVGHRRRHQTHQLRAYIPLWCHAVVILIKHGWFAPEDPLPASIEHVPDPESFHARNL